MAGCHPGVGLERLLQLAQRHAGDVGKLQEIDRVFRRISGPFTDAFHDGSLFSAPLQSSTVQTHPRIVEDEQTVLQQLICKSIFIKRINSLRQLRESRA